MRKISFVSGEFYHIYNRGVDKRPVFSGPEEYARFLAYLHLLNDTDSVRPADFFRTHSFQEAVELLPSERLVALGAFCLMPNHFHLYATPLVEGGMSKFMQKLETAYTKYFNEKHSRTGSLFEGTFKAEHVTDDIHAKYLFSYIHLNPAKLKDAKWRERKQRNWEPLRFFVANYPYSSYQEYLSNRHILTSPAHFPGYFRTKKQLQRHLEDWLANAPA